MHISFQCMWDVPGQKKDPQVQTEYPGFFFSAFPFFFFLSDLQLSSYPRKPKHGSWLSCAMLQGSCQHTFLNLLSWLFFSIATAPTQGLYFPKPYCKWEALRKRKSWNLAPQAKTNVPCYPLELVLCFVLFLPWPVLLHWLTLLNHAHVRQINKC